MQQGIQAYIARLANLADAAAQQSQWQSGGLRPALLCRTARCGGSLASRAPRMAGDHHCPTTCPAGRACTMQLEIRRWLPTPGVCRRICGACVCQALVCRTCAKTHVKWKHLARLACGLLAPSRSNCRRCRIAELRLGICGCATEALHAKLIPRRTCPGQPRWWRAARPGMAPQWPAARAPAHTP